MLFFRKTIKYSSNVLYNFARCSELLFVNRGWVSVKKMKWNRPESVQTIHGVVTKEEGVSVAYQAYFVHLRNYCMYVPFTGG